VPEFAPSFYLFSDDDSLDSFRGELSGLWFTTSLPHFSSGFVGEVVYEDPDDLSCLEVKLLQGRTFEPSALALFVAIQTCAGEPLTSLSAEDFILLEDGTPLSSESVVRVLPWRGREAFVTLLIDLSSSTMTALPLVVAACTDFLERLSAVAPARFQVQIEVFDGSAHPTVWEPFRIGSEAAMGALQHLADYVPTDPNSTNLHGALIGAISATRDAQDKFRARNDGGALTTGHIVVFSDGADTSGYHLAEDVVSAINDDSTTVTAVQLQTADSEFSTLPEIANSGFFEATSVDGLSAAFAAVANRIAGLIKGSYLLGYCSPKKAGTHSVSISLSLPDAEQVEGVDFAFDATGFGAGCNASVFDQVCDGRNCGGLVCGACDDRHSACVTETGACLSYCDLECAEAGEHMNPLGYVQSCSGQCDDGNACTGDDVCGSGACSGEPIDCNDDNPCTNDYCNSATGCEHTPASLECPGGYCDGAVCVPCSCDDGNVCTIDSCDSGFNCQHAAASGPCVTGYCSAATCHPFIEGADRLFAGASTACARIQESGAWWCWGATSFSGSGVGTASVATDIPIFLGANDISIGPATCFTRGGELYCVGRNTALTFLTPDQDFVTTQPIKLSLGVGVVSEVEQTFNGTGTGSHDICAVVAGEVFCWGTGTECGFGLFPGYRVYHSYTPIRIDGPRNVVQLAMAHETRCARQQDGRVWCWGDGINLGGDGGCVYPSEMDLPLSADIALSRFSGASLGVDGRVVDWGGDVHAPDFFKQVDLQGEISDVGASRDSSLLCAAGPSVQCWELGGAPVTIDAADDSEPPGPSISVISGIRSCALHLSGRASCWGLGVLGTGADAFGPPEQSTRFVIRAL